MFKYCSSLKSLDLSKFNCDSITDSTKDMLEMFKNCSSLNANNIKCKDIKILNQLDIDLKVK